MHIDYRSPTAWTDLNNHVASELDVVLDKTTVRNYLGIGHALVEVCTGIAKLYPLKKKIYYFKNMNPYFESALLQLAKEGYKIVPLDLNVLEEPVGWASALDREDLFVLYSVDEPFLGQVYNLTKFEAALIEKNIFKIRVSHNLHFFKSDDVMKVKMPERNLAALYSLTVTRALALLGERGKIAPFAADQLFYGEAIESDSIKSDSIDWSWFKRSAETSDKTASKASAISIIEKFENEAREKLSAQSFYRSGASRMADRAVIYWENIDGYAIIDRLAQNLHLKLQSPGVEERMETASLSRWGGVRTLDFLKSTGLSPEALRGLIIIDVKLLQEQPSLIDILRSVRESILKDQSGE
jgi:hypothetical protein